MNRDLGQIAYEAYCENTGWRSLITGDRLPSWNQQDAALQSAWNVAALAVVKVMSEDEA